MRRTDPAGPDALEGFRASDEAEKSRMTPEQIKAYKQRRLALALHPDDVELFADKQGWVEGVHYIVDYKAKRLKLGNTDSEEE